MCSVVSDSVTSWPVALQAPLSMGFSGQEYWSGLPFPPPGDLPHPGIEFASPESVKKQQLELDMKHRLVPNRERNTSRLYIVTVLI